jgi:phosphodiesterase/alkaline phosphatase D-like protein
MLGKRQLAKFERAVAGSAAKFKVIMNEVPIQQFYALPYDRWEGYANERAHLLAYLHDNVKNTIFLTTDVHANLVNDARFQTLESGGPKDSGILDVTTGPVATMSFAHEIEGTTNSPGSGKLVSTVFFLGQPPNGVGMKCSAVDVYSYGQVSVSSSKLTIGLKDINGKAVKSDDGKQCGPFTVTAK